MPSTDITKAVPPRYKGVKLFVVADEMEKDVGRKQ